VGAADGSTSVNWMIETEREQRERKRNAVAREMSRLRSTDEPAEPDEPDLVETVGEEQRRERELQDDDRED
jgi:hypothetical protein